MSSTKSHLIGVQTSTVVHTGDEQTVVTLQSYNFRCGHITRAPSYRPASHIRRHVRGDVRHRGDPGGGAA